MSKILFVVHRYAPYPGGSEYYVRDMAEEMIKRGHNVTVLAHEHKGDLNGVKVTDQYQILQNNWDMIIIHGCDCISQNIVLSNIDKIQSPICYMIIKPSDSPTSILGLRGAKYLAYSTTMDLEHIKKYGHENKARRIRHGIVPKNSLGVKDLNWVHGPYYVSAGGFYPHKAMDALANVWNKQTTIKADLELFGYADGNMPSYPNVKSWLGLERSSMLGAIANSNGYIMNSYEEGFGLVLLEAMLNKVPVFARNIAGAKDMKPHVMTYENEDDLMFTIKSYESWFNESKQGHLEQAYKFVITNHTITQTCNDIEDIIKEK